MNANRIPSNAWSEPIAEALRLVRRWRHIIGDVRFVCGVAPSFVGLHSFDPDVYGVTAHACYPWHLNVTGPLRHTPTIVLPKPPSRATVVHELGHVLHYRLDFDPDPLPVTEYAKTNKYESFAEYFTTGLFHNYGNEDVYQSDDLNEFLSSLRVPA